MSASISASDRRLQGGSFDMLSFVLVDDVELMSELSVPDRRNARNVAVFLGLGLGRTGTGRSSSSSATASLAGRKQLINMLVFLLNVWYRESKGGLLRGSVAVARSLCLSSEPSMRDGRLV